MNKLPVIFIFLFCIALVKAQTRDSVASNNISNNQLGEEGVIVCRLVSLSIACDYPGGMDAFYNLFAKNISSSNLKRAAEANTHVTFIVEKNGSMTNIDIYNAPNPEIKNEILRALALGKKWTPSIDNGNPITKEFDLPIVKESD